MATRSNNIILLVTRERLARFDLPRGGGSGQLFAVQRPESQEDLASLVEAAIRLGGSLHGQVWVITDEVFTQTLSLSSAALRDLQSKELDHALSFEAQAFSGIPAADSVIQWKELAREGSKREFWIVQMSRSEHQQVDEAVSRAGGRLAGILHPAGIPQRIQNDKKNSSDFWKRIEFWHESVATLESKAGVRSIRIEHVNVDRWRDEALNAANPESVEILMAIPARIHLPESVEQVYRLDYEPVLQAWLETWSSELTKRAPEVPVLLPLHRPLSASTRVSLSAFLVLLATGLCWWHYDSLQQERSRFEKEKAKIQEPIDRFKKSQENARKLEPELVKLRTERANQKVKLQRLDDLTNWPVNFLSAVASLAPEGLLIDEIDLGFVSGESHVRGLCLQAALADQFAGLISQKFEGDACQVLAPAKQIKRNESGAVIYEFDLKILHPDLAAKNAVLPTARSSQ